MRVKQRGLASSQAFQEHGIAVAEKSILLRNGVGIQSHHMLIAGKGTDQHHQSTFGQMEIGNQTVYPLKFKAWCDEDLSVAL